MKNIEMLKVWEKGNHKRAYLSEKVVSNRNQYDIQEVQYREHRRGFDRW